MGASLASLRLLLITTALCGFYAGSLCPIGVPVRHPVQSNSKAEISKLREEIRELAGQLSLRDQTIQKLESSTPTPVVMSKSDTEILESVTNNVEMVESVAELLPNIEIKLGAVEELALDLADQGPAIPENYAKLLPVVEKMIGRSAKIEGQLPKIKESLLALAPHLIPSDSAQALAEKEKLIEELTKQLQLSEKEKESLRQQIAKVEPSQQAASAQLIEMTRQIEAQLKNSKGLEKQVPWLQQKISQLNLLLRQQSARMGQLDRAMRTSRMIPLPSPVRVGATQMAPSRPGIVQAQMAAVARMDATNLRNQMIQAMSALRISATRLSNITNMRFTPMMQKLIRVGALANSIMTSSATTQAAVINRLRGELQKALSVRNTEKQFAQRQLLGLRGTAGAQSQKVVALTQKLATMEQNFGQLSSLSENHKAALAIKDNAIAKLSMELNATRAAMNQTTAQRAQEMMMVRQQLATYEQAARGQDKQSQTSEKDDSRNQQTIRALNEQLKKKTASMDELRRSMDKKKGGQLTSLYDLRYIRELEGILGTLVSKNGLLGIQRTPKTHASYTAVISDIYKNFSTRLNLYSKVADVIENAHQKQTVANLTTKLLKAVENESYYYENIEINNPEIVGKSGVFKDSKELAKLSNRFSEAVKKMNLGRAGQHIVTSIEKSFQQQVNLEPERISMSL
ncbi:hypothetical protein HOD08_01145 [bacterium]|nr:hypothetical protein [bacterium]